LGAVDNEKAVTGKLVMVLVEGRFTENHKHIGIKHFRIIYFLAAYDHIGLTWAASLLSAVGVGHHSVLAIPNRCLGEYDAG
jgi:uncharacterized membrane protein